MEDYEKQVIISSLEYICRNTVAETQILLSLQSKDWVTKREAAEIEAKMVPMIRIYEIFILMTKTRRKGSMAALLNVLQNTYNQHIAQYLQQQLEVAEIKLGISSDFKRANTEASENLKSDDTQNNSREDHQWSTNGGNTVSKWDINKNGKTSRDSTIYSQHSANVKQTVWVRGTGNNVAARDINC